MLRCVRIRALALATLWATVACGDGDPKTVATPHNPGGQPRGVAAAEQPKPHKKTRRERPLPNFSGWTLDNERLEISSLLGKRLLLFFFNPEVAEAPPAAEAVGEISKLRGKHNFEIVGIAMGSDRKTVVSFVEKYNIEFRVIDDSSAAIAQRIGIRRPMGILGVDAEGYVIFGMERFGSDSPGASSATEDRLRTALRLPPASTAVEPVLGNRPIAPLFAADIMDSDERFDLAQHRGEAVILIFFIHSCPHCHETLRFFREALDELPHDKRPTLVGVEISGKTGAVRRSMKEMNLDFFPVVFDDDHSIRSDYGVFAGVPDTFFIDAEGHIVAHVSPWIPERDEHLARMRMAKLAGAPIPMLLRKSGYSGSDTCGVCHELEHETWIFTQHATAYDTLVKHGEANNEECVSCHVVGYSKPGGFTSATETPSLEDVGCEACHGRGGPHLSPGFVEGGDYSKICETCHNSIHSLGFEYATFRPRISHAENAHVRTLSLEERNALLAKLGAPRDVLPTNANYVGSDACRDCHEPEHTTWVASPHAQTLETLSRAGESDNADCLKCHTTGYGRPGGFPAAAAAESHADLARVGCESCHGPGSEHVKDGSDRIGSIVSLADKCDSCVILQICGGCHDDANDPGFEFEVLDKIEAQRHGTIEPGTGKPVQPTAHRFDKLDVALSTREFQRAVERAFEGLDQGRSPWVER